MHPKSHPKIAAEKLSKNDRKNIEQISTIKDTHIPVGHEIYDSTSLCKEEIIETNPQYDNFEMTENDHLQDSQDEDILKEEIFEDTTKEISTNEEHNFEMSQNDDFVENTNQLLNEETTKEITT